MSTDSKNQEYTKVNHIMAGETRFNIKAKSDSEASLDTDNPFKRFDIQYNWSPKNGPFENSPHGGRFEK